MATIHSPSNGRRYVIDADGNLITARYHTRLKPGQRLASEADVTRLSAAPSEPVVEVVTAAAEVAIPVEPTPVAFYVGDDFAVKTPRERAKAAKAPKAD
jgi:hypothetical protein